MQIDYNKLKEKFYMFGDKPTHELILNDTNIKLLYLIHEDLQFYITPGILHISYILSVPWRSLHSSSHNSLQYKINNFDDVVIEIERYIKKTIYYDWYKYEKRTEKLKRICHL